jgi:hypothetical protein
MTRVPKQLFILEENPALRRKIILNLPRNNAAAFYELMSEILRHDPSPVIRHEVAFILGTVRSPRSLSLLIEIIKNDSSDLVKHEAIEAIGDLGIRNKRMSSLLRKLLTDKNQFIKDTAKIALETLKL